MKVNVWINLNIMVQALFIYIIYYFTGKFIAKIPDPESSVFFTWVGTQQQSTLWIQEFINLYLNYVTDGTSSCFYAVLCARGFIRQPQVLHLSLSIPAMEMDFFVPASNFSGVKLGECIRSVAGSAWNISFNDTF